MPRHIVTADTCTLTNVNGYTATQSLGNATSVAQALGTKQDSRYVRLTLPYNSSGSATADAVFTATLLPAIDPAKKQSRFIRCVVAIRTTSSSGNSHELRFRCGTTTTFVQDVQIGNSLANATYTFLYPINGSNGGTQYWTGADPLDVKVTLVQLRSNVNGTTATVDVDYVRFEYGEADAYIDVDATGYANRNAGLGGGPWLNPQLCLAPDTDGTSYATSSTTSYALDRTWATFGVPGKFSGLEIWDAMVPNRIDQLALSFAHYPLTAPVPVYDLRFLISQTPLPPVSYTPAGGSVNNAGVMGYWVWGGGPGDLFIPDEFSNGSNGWPGLSEARLCAGANGYLAADHAVMLSSVVTATNLNRMFYRIFYDRTAALPLLFCEA